MSFPKQLCFLILRLTRRGVTSFFKTPVFILENAYQRSKLTLLVIFYNDQVDFNYCVDTLLEPIYWFVDHFTATLGPLFVFLVVSLLSFFVLVAYLIGLPYWLSKSYLVTAIALIVGNYILVNVAFHYYMALKTSPGHPPQNRILFEVVSICKKCINPKPPRTHHCSVCDKCILKMDHHCPWLNNCVGHYNHRFFFLFCLYTWLGSVFIMIFGASIAYEHFIAPDLSKETHKESNQDKKAIFSRANFLDNLLFFVQNNLDDHRNGLIVFELLLCVGAFISVGGLGYWHLKLITRGETCVETYINRKRKLQISSKGDQYQNPFDKGPKQNWINFLGLNQPNITWRHILFPSKHLPIGTGLSWDINK